MPYKTSVNAGEEEGSTREYALQEYYNQDVFEWPGMHSLLVEAGIDGARAFPIDCILERSTAGLLCDDTLLV